METFLEDGQLLWLSVQPPHNKRRSRFPVKRSIEIEVLLSLKSLELKNTRSIAAENSLNRYSPFESLFLLFCRKSVKDQGPEEAQFRWKISTAVTFSQPTRALLVRIIWLEIKKATRKMVPNMIPELDITWFKDEKRLKELKKSCDLNKWKADVEVFDKSFKTLKEIVSKDQFSKKTNWTLDIKLVILGKFCSEFSTEKQKFMDLVTSITSMLNTKAQQELLAHQKQTFFGLDKAVELWTTKNASSWLSRN